MELLEQDGVEFDAIRIKAIPFNHEVESFIEEHDEIFVIEQNRDAQFRSIIINELDTNPEKLIKVLNYDGMPITAQKILDEILAHIGVPVQN